jgi:YidC/Oxa1 family membrane protein insertase
MRKLLKEFKNWRDFQKQKNNFDVIFYAESSSYYIYFESIIKHLIEDYNCVICYLTSSFNDPVLLKDNDLIKTYYIGKGSVRTILFSSLDVKVMVMTMPDLNKYHIRRSNNPVHYVYIPHNMNSTHMVFRTGAFDYYDTFFCIGPYHVAELREAEKMNNSKPKELIEIGYPRLDDLYHEAIDLDMISYKQQLKIMIAPSWYIPGILDTIGENIIKLLLDANHQVFVRPHRDSRSYIPNKMDHIKNIFSNYDNFNWLEGKSSNEYLYQSHILITDWSGSAFSFSFGLNRPVIFIDLPPKINNPDYLKFNNKPIEFIMRSKIGSVISINDIDEINTTISEMQTNYKYYKNNINKLRGELIYNFGNSANKGAEYIANLS